MSAADASEPEPATPPLAPSERAGSALARLARQLALGRGVRAVAHDPELRLCLASSLAEVDRLAAAWRELDRQIAYPLAHFAWIRASLAGLESGVRPHVVAVLRGSALVAVAPLVQVKLRGMTWLTPTGVTSLFEPLALVGTEPAAVELLVDSLLRAGWPLFFERVPRESPSVAALEQLCPGRALLHRAPQDGCPYIALDPSWKEPEQRLNSGRRSDYQRARRKAEKLGPVRAQIHVPKPAELGGLLEQAFEVEAQSWKGQSGTALARDARRGEFYREYAREACAQGILRMCFLHVGDAIAAMQIAVEWAGGFWLLKIGYDARFSSCSPGMLLLRETLRHAAESGLERYEFLGRPESWIELWTQAQHEQAELRVYPFRPRGLAALAVDGIAWGVQRWKMR